MRNDSGIGPCADVKGLQAAFNPLNEPRHPAGRCRSRIPPDPAVLARSDKAKRDAQIDKIILQAKAIGTFAFIGYPFEAKNAPFKMRTPTTRELEIA